MSQTTDNQAIMPESTNTSPLTLLSDTTSTTDATAREDEKNVNDVVTSIVATEMVVSSFMMASIATVLNGSSKDGSDQITSSAVAAVVEVATDEDNDRDKPSGQQPINAKDKIEDKDIDKTLDDAFIQDTAANQVNVVLSVASELSPPLIDDMLPDTSVPEPSSLPAVATVDREGVSEVPLPSSIDQNASITAVTATATATAAVLSAVAVAVVSTTTTDAQKAAHDDEEHAQILAGIETHMQTAKLAHEHEQEAAQLLAAISFKVQAAKLNNEHENEAAQLLEAIRYYTPSTYPLHTLSTRPLNTPYRRDIPSSISIRAKVLLAQQEQEAAQLLAAISAKVRAAKKLKEEEDKEDEDTEIQIRFARQNLERKQHEEADKRYRMEKARASASASALAATSTLSMLDGWAEQDEETLRKHAQSRHWVMKDDLSRLLKAVHNKVCIALDEREPTAPPSKTLAI